MKYKKLIFLCAERNENLLNAEVRAAVTTLKSLEKVLTSNVSLTTISLKHEEKANNIDDGRVFDVHQNEVDWKNFQNSQENFYENGQNFDQANRISDEIVFCDLYKIAEFLHNFIDENFICGHTSMHVFWCVQNYIPCPSEAIELYGSLERLLSWHNCDLKVVTKNSETIDEWLEFLPFHVVQSCSESLSSIVNLAWHGNLSFSIEEKLYPVEYPKIEITEKFKGHNSLRKIFESNYVLPTAEVFTEVDYEKIPPVFIKKGSMAVIKPSENLKPEERKDILDILKRFTENEKVSTLIRIRHTSNREPALREWNSVNTASWKQTIASGNFEANPSYYFDCPHDVTVLILVPETLENDSFACFVMQDPTSYGDEIERLVKEQRLNEQFDERLVKKVQEMLVNFKELPKNKVDQLKWIILNLSGKIDKKIRTLPNYETDFTKRHRTAVEIASCKEILKWIDTHAKSNVDLHPVNTTLVAETSIHKELWPEFRALEINENKKNQICRISSGDYLLGCAPPLPQKKADVVDLDQIISSLKEEIKGNERSSKDPEKYSKTSFKWLKELPWNAANDTRFPGIYYNNAETEKFERKFTRSCEQLVKYETKSTLVQNNAENENKFGNKSKKTGSKKSCKKLLKDCDTSSSIVTRGHILREKAHKATLLHNKIRRSPRKHLKPSEASSETLKKQKCQFKKSNINIDITDNAGLSSVHKSKLRDVIYSALEKEGVPMNHNDKFFLSCFKKMFSVCKPFALDVVGLRNTTANFAKIANSQVKNVVEFEKMKMGSD